MGRHRHLTCVRSDGLSAVLRPLLDDRRILAATLVDVGSGLILDGYADDPALADLELLGAGHADVVRAADALGTEPRAELTVDTGDGRHHLLHAVPDPHGDRLVVAVVVRGSARHVERARRRLRTVEVDALTAGPTLQRRPVDGSWVVEPAGPAAAAPSAGTPTNAQEPPALPATLAPLSAMSPRSPGDPAGAGAAPPPWTVASVASVASLSDGRPATGRTGPAGR